MFSLGFVIIFNLLEWQRERTKGQASTSWLTSQMPQRSGLG